MVKIMGIINLTPDSFFAPSRYNMSILESNADIVDIGAISTRPGAEDVSEEEEWSRLLPFLEQWRQSPPKGKQLSIDTTRASIVQKAFDTVGPFIVNDISAGEDDSAMLPAVRSLGLPYIAMHKRGNPRTMDSLADTGSDIIVQLLDYFERFANDCGLDKWILDPGLGFAKSKEQNIEIVQRLGELKRIGRPILIGAADKRFTEGNTEYYHLLALRQGADIFRVHDVVAFEKTYAQYQKECAAGENQPVPLRREN